MRIISKQAGDSRPQTDHEPGEIYGIVSVFVVPCDDLPALSRTDLPLKSNAVVHQVPMRSTPTGASQRNRTVDANTTVESLVEKIPRFMIAYGTCTSPVVEEIVFPATRTFFEEEPSSRD